MDTYSGIQKQFHILVNGQKVKIVSFKREQYVDDFTGEEVSMLELTTHIKHPLLHQEELTVRIQAETPLRAMYITGFAQDGLFRYRYRIVAE